ncbi:hypothetical protein A2774_01575 [Candidatus Roizmanbacteria bacterium RIFCSPHIGHO2_01_FULL_39_12c]|uniref:Uncharacterized protein n=1 Tax=Candidatus Roizmanbacteria bacterium RIFCSPHIGHO2_01_FULL_39_12c TaxID=1802031 RepID=A0A1F7G857_9BACT|nr:MAG: hypothetical protein A2774_01575 [Candidatus Roizmanbacteria bacterium RIFCSPHIGHO2_01_FULL_39_12c]OGK46593.1 MAG: hypothetical protein A2963_02580 [Candidatus Roizmanbacteria bacterium RIFCSPLOWO2_01_FULL_40_13]
MKAIDPFLIDGVADLFVNLAAGWVGAAFIAPNYTLKRGIVKLTTLIFDLILAIFCLVTAIYLRKLI